MSRFQLYGPRSGQHWFRVGTVDVTTTVLVTAISVLSMVLYAISRQAAVKLALGPSLVLSGEVWRLATWPLFNPPDIFVAFSIAAFWYFGSSLEALLGRIRFLVLLAILVILPAVIFTVIATPSRSFAGVFGMGLLTSAVVVAFLAAFPGTRSFFNLPLWVVCSAYLGLSVLQYLSIADWWSLLFLLLMIATALLAARAFGISRLTWIPRVPLPSALTGAPSSRPEKKRAKASHLKVVRTNELDTLLDKIAESGLQSLTAAERRRLDELSGR